MTDFVMQSQAAVDMDGPAMPARGAGGAGDGDAGAFFENLLDIINPLQHLPIISTIYRAATGDAIAAPARLIGGALYGGPFGAAGAAVNLAVENITGSDIGEHVVALVTGEDAAADSQMASRAGSAATSSEREPVLVAFGDVNAMMPDAIIWNGEWRTLAALSTQQARVELQPEPPAPPAVTPDPTPPKPVVPPAAIAEPEAAQAAPRAVPAQTAWFAAAIAEAEQNRDSIEAGRGSTPTATPAWIATAMEQALDKYQTMAIDRSARAHAAPNSPPDAR